MPYAANMLQNPLFAASTDDTLTYQVKHTISYWGIVTPVSPLLYNANLQCVSIQFKPIIRVISTHRFYLDLSKICSIIQGYRCSMHPFFLSLYLPARSPHLKLRRGLCIIQESLIAVFPDRRATGRITDEFQAKAVPSAGIRTNPASPLPSFCRSGAGKRALPRSGIAQPTLLSCARRGCATWTISETEADLYRIPVIPTLYLKRNPLFSISPDELAVQAHSSGTKGLRSRVGFDAQSLRLGMAMMRRFFAYHKVTSLIPANYIVLGYEPGGSDLGAAKTAYGTTKFAPALHREYALKHDGTGYAQNAEGVRAALLRYRKQGFPVRFIGFPAYLYFLVHIAEGGRRLAEAPPEIHGAAGRRLETVFADDEDGPGTRCTR